MRADSVAWERAAEVQEAAEGWRRAGAIGTPTYDAIRNAYPDPCVTPSAVWRVLTACMVTAVMLSTLGALFVGLQPGATALSLLLIVEGAAAMVATERLEASPRSVRRGAAGATAFWGCVFVIAGFWFFLTESRIRVGLGLGLDVLFFLSALVWGLGCWRWGSPLFAGLAAVSLFLVLGRAAYGRVLWVLVGAGMVALFARRSDDGAWAPSHRRSAMVLLIAGMSAVYLAVNVYSVDVRFIETFTKYTARTTAPRWSFILASFATAVVPLGVIAWGLKARRIVLLDTGVVLLALSLVTLRQYVHVAPLWVILTASGALLIVVALVVERALRRAPDGERAAFTADPLFSDDRRQRILQTVSVAASFTPAARVTAAQEPGFAGRGGEFGGAGASDQY
jgi:hypothetical protein